MDQKERTLVSDRLGWLQWGQIWHFCMARCCILWLVHISIQTHFLPSQMPLNFFWDFGLLPPPLSVFEQYLSGLMARLPSKNIRSTWGVTRNVSVEHFLGPLAIPSPAWWLSPEKACVCESVCVCVCPPAAQVSVAVPDEPLIPNLGGELSGVWTDWWGQREVSS